MRRPTLARHANTAISINDRGQYETRKLLTHLLDRLEARPPPPDLLDRAALNARKATGKAKGKGRRHVVHIGETIVSAAHLPIKGHQHRRSGSEASSSKAAAENYHLLEEGEWYTDQTCDLVEQMRDLLILADKQKMDLFGISNMGSEATRSSSSSKRAGSRFSSTGFVARGSDGYPDGTPTVSGPVLLERLVGVIRSLLTVDCIHKAVQISLLRPPHILQAFCLDVAAVLYHKGSLDVQLALMDAVIASLYGVADALRDKVCEWLEGRLGEQLHNLARELGEDIEASAVVWKGEWSWT